MEENFSIRMWEYHHIFQSIKFINILSSSPRHLAR